MPEQTEFNLTGNEITPKGKFLGGFFLILFTAGAIFFLFAFWPDKIPDINQKSDGKYEFKFFGIRLLKDCDTIVADTGSNVKITTSAKEKDGNNKKPDTSKKTKTDTSVVSNTPGNENKDSDTMSKNNKVRPICRCQKYGCLKNGDVIDLNTIFLILVAITGFLGNMIHIATSFTTFVGNDNFKKSWTLWYIIKPFTAAALAIIIYFIIRAGFLSYGSDAKNVSLYGILALSALAGLFTDTATLKLKEVFETIFRPKDLRDDKLTPFSIDSIVPEILVKGINNLSLKGKGLNSKKLIIKIDTQIIANPTMAADSISFTYTVADAVASQTKLILSVFDESNKEIFRKQLTVQ